MGFSEAWKSTGRAEGGFSNNPKDTGGPTNHGITEEVARANGYTGDMRDLTPELANQIAKSQYWDLINLDKVAALSDKIADEVFDTGINCGQQTAMMFLQEALNMFNHEGRDYKDLETDGLAGPMTIKALESYLTQRKVEGETVLLRVLNSLQGAYYVRITKIRSANEEFIYGWFKNRVTI